MFSKSVICLWVSADVFVVHVSMHTWLCRSVLRNHISFHVRDFIGFPCAPLPVCVCVCVCVCARAYVRACTTHIAV